MIRQDTRESTIQRIRSLKLIGGISRRRRLPKQIVPRTVEREYSLELLKVLKVVRESLGDLLRELPHLLGSVGRERERLDVGESKRIRELLERAGEQIRARIRPQQLEDLAERFARRTSVYQRGQLDRQVKAALGADIFIADRRLPSLIEGFVSENVALIKDLPAKVLSDIEKTVTRGVANATNHRDLAKELEEKFELGENRAKLIARDQINKIYGQINATRQEELGINEFIWRTSQDERVRPEHAEREGNVYSYSDPPDGELPGQPINCRCYAEPVFKSLQEGIDEDNG
jgi:SPP1 gp7 family putative phage head morphogenesis protein